MKPKSRLRSYLALAGSSLLAISYSHAATYYWDDNGTTAGFGTANGTWGSAGSTLWNNDILGGSVGSPNTLGTSITTTFSDLLNFGTATAGLGAGTITVSGTVDAGDITFGTASGAIVLSGGRDRVRGTVPSLPGSDARPGPLQPGTHESNF